MVNTMNYTGVYSARLTTRSFFFLIIGKKKTVYKADVSFEKICSAQFVCRCLLV